MDFDAAIDTWMTRNGKRIEHIAVILGVSAKTVTKWRKRQALPSYTNVQKARAEMHGFADLLDGKAAA